MKIISMLSWNLLLCQIVSVDLHTATLNMKIISVSYYRIFQYIAILLTTSVLPNGMTKKYRLQHKYNDHNIMGFFFSCGTPEFTILCPSLILARIITHTSPKLSLR